MIIKKEDLRFNQLTVEEVLKRPSANGNGVASSYSIVYAALVSGYFVKEKQKDFTFEDVCNAVDEKVLTVEGDTELAEWITGFTDSVAFQSKLKEAARPSGEIKKKKALK